MKPFAAKDGVATVEPWDYRYYQEKVRKAKYDLSEAEIKPYFEQGNLLKGMLWAAEQLYDLHFTENTGKVAVFNPDVRILARSPGERAFVMRAHSERYGELTVEATSDYDAATQVNRATWYISTPDQPDCWVAPIHLRSIFPQELPLLLAASGFRLLQRMGDLQGGPFTSSSARQVCVCTVDDGERGE